MNNRKQLIIPTTIFLISLLCFVSFRIIQHHYDTQTAKAQVVLNQKKKQLKNIQQYKNQQAVEKQLTSTNESTANTGNEALAKQEINAKAQKLFKILLTYSSQADWDKRSKLASPYVTTNVLHNTVFFNDGKDSTGHSIINTLGQKSSFIDATIQTGKIDNNVVSGTAKVTYSVRHDNGTPASTTDYYTYQYDLNQHKFISLNRLGASDTSVGEVE